MGEGLVKPPQMKPCWVAPPHLPQGGTILIFSLPGQGHVMTDRARVALKTFCMALFIDLYSYSQFLFFFGGGGGGDYVQDHTQCMFSNLQEINTLELEPTKSQIAYVQMHMSPISF